MSEKYSKIAIDELDTCNETNNINIFIGFPKYPNKEEREKIFLENNKNKFNINKN